MADTFICGHCWQHKPIASRIWMKGAKRAVCTTCKPKAGKPTARSVTDAHARGYLLGKLPPGVK